MNNIEIIVNDVEIPWDQKLICRFCEEILAVRKIDGWEFSLVFCGDEYIKMLNKQYREKDEPTDILTFCEEDSRWDLDIPAGDDAEELHYAGDMAISVQTLEKNAGYFNVDIKEELARLLIHGILHLEGMDHQTNDAEEPMIRLQENILKNFGEYKF